MLSASLRRLANPTSAQDPCCFSEVVLCCYLCDRGRSGVAVSLLPRAHFGYVASYTYPLRLMWCGNFSGKSPQGSLGRVRLAIVASNRSVVQLFLVLLTLYKSLCIHGVRMSCCAGCCSIFCTSMCPLFATPTVFATPFQGVVRMQSRCHARLRCLLSTLIRPVGDGGWGETPV